MNNTKQDIQNLYEGIIKGIKDLELQYNDILPEQEILSEKIILSVTALKDTALRNLDMALTNPVTNGNNPLVLEQLIGQIDRCYVVQIDIDNFKGLNDTKGHAYGDLVLKELYEFLESNMRQAGIKQKQEIEKRKMRIKLSDVIHEHGEEFKILLYADNEKDAYDVVERLRYGFFEFTMNTKDIFEFPVTFSAGISYYDKNRKTKKQAFEEADKAMYEAKNTGKNKTVIYKPKPYEQLELRF